MAAQELSPADQRKRDAMFELLNLQSVQEAVIDSLFASYGRQLEAVSMEIKAMERDPNLSEEEVVLRMSVLNQEKADIRAVRELDLLSVLLPEQRSLYEEQIQPKKPAVLHFGVHNRMDCNVCTK